NQDQVVYSDPGRYGVLTGKWSPWEQGVRHPRTGEYAAQDGDVVVVTHDHHYNPDGIRRVASPDATIVAYEGINADRIDRVDTPIEALPYDTVRVEYGQTISRAGIDLETIPAHNHPEGKNLRSDGTPIHPEGFGCGFCFDLDGVVGFWPGDSDVLDS
ncbi:MAG: MBL fold metallo-hydrolase, partial [Halobacteriaceae archaeon]